MEIRAVHGQNDLSHGFEGLSADEFVAQPPIEELDERDSHFEPRSMSARSCGVEAEPEGSTYSAS